MKNEPAEIDRPGVAVIHLGADLDSARSLLLGRDVSALLVVDPDGIAMGVLSMSDLLRIARVHAIGDERAAFHLPRRTVEHGMQRGVISVADAADLRGAAAKMVEHRVHRVFVLDAGRPCAVISTHEIARALRDERRAAPVARHSTRALRTVSCREPMGEAVDRLADSGLSGLVVTDDGWPVGLFTQREALAADKLPATTPVVEAMSFALVCVPEQTPLWRAAGQACASRARRVITIDSSHQAVGMLSGLAFAEAYLEPT